MKRTLSIAAVPRVISVNIGPNRPTDHSRAGVTGIDKRPITGLVEVRAPGPKGIGGSGLVGDEIGSPADHGGDDQAVYAYAREDLDSWSAELGRPLADGSFGENITTEGIDVNAALIGERWRIGTDVVLEITSARIPCRTFAGWVGEPQWVRRFTRRCLPGPYLRVIRPGRIRSGDALTVVHRPEHEVTVCLAFRAVTGEPELLSRLLVADALHPEARAAARRRTGIVLDRD